jgi:arginyl-tRNA--protein-N-Asp/Glu arginylyltransferase
VIETHLPRQLSGQRYDQYLAAGWFRGSVMLYKMDLLIMDQQLWSVVNIRLKLPTFTLRKSQRRCIRKVEQAFQVIVQPAQLNYRREMLYQQHKARFKGFVHGTLSEYLHAGFNRTVFNTMEVGVYDGKKLIAVSYFDLGQESMASLLAVYDQDYEAFSLGRYTMLKEIEFGQRHGFKWFYPGYVLDRPSLFDYKTELGPMQYYTPNKRWGAYRNHNPQQSKALELTQNSEMLCKALKGAGIHHKLRLYPFFSMAYLGIWTHQFLPLPAICELGNDPHGTLVIGCDPVSMKWLAGHMRPCPNESQFMNREHAAEYEDPDAYLSHLMEFEPLPLTLHTIEDVLDFALHWTESNAFVPMFPMIQETTKP